MLNKIMTTAQIIAIVLVVLAITDLVAGYYWLLPKFGKRMSKEKLAALEPSEREFVKKQQKASRIIRGTIDIWVVIALAIAYFLWQNPDIF